MKPGSTHAVVVGYDGFEAARRALARAAAAAGAGGRVVVVPARPPADGGDATARETAPLPDEAARLLREQGVRATTQTLEGDPAEALIETAREAGAGLIVVGARGGSYLERVLRGSVAERLVARAPCDVLVVR
jgi:nucleotide-binding universal stress UspA family protein